MIQHEFTERATHRLAMRLRWAKLPMPACIEDSIPAAPAASTPRSSLKSVISAGSANT